MVHIDPKNVTKIVQEAASQTVAKSKTVLRELEMIPTYLELATIKGAERFSSGDIKSITKHFEDFDTNLSRIDVLKELLSIGAEKGKPLSANELNGFLEVTSSMSSNEQKNILKFLKAAKEKEGGKVTYQGIREQFDFDKFKEKTLRFHRGTSLSETDIKLLYERAIDNEYRIASNEYYNKGRAVLKNPPAQFVTTSLNPDVTKTIANCEDPTTFLEVIERIGVSNGVLSSANDLTKIFRLSEGNPDIVRDLSVLFYPEEISQITKVFMSDSGINLKTYEGLVGKSFSEAPNIKGNRGKFLKQFGIKDKVKLSQLYLRNYQDVYSNSPFGLRGKRISGGNYEGGKKK